MICNCTIKEGKGTFMHIMFEIMCTINTNRWKMDGEYIDWSVLIPIENPFFFYK